MTAKGSEDIATAEAREFAEKDGRLPWTVWPAGVVCVKELPKTRAYKLDRAGVQKLALEASADKVSEAASAEPAEAAAPKPPPGQQQPAVEINK